MNDSTKVSLGVSLGVGIGILIGGVLTTYFRPLPSSKRSKPAQEKAAGFNADGMDIAGGKLRLLRKAETVLRHRTSQIVIVIERSVDTHNYSAIIRTSEAMGIQHLWVISPPDLDGGKNGAKEKGKKKRKDFWVEDDKKKKEHVAFAKKGGKWVGIRNFDSTEACLEALAQDNREVWVTDLSQHAEDLDDVLGTSCPSLTPLPKKLAVVFGSEGMGVSATMLQAAHKRVYIKMHGFADSLNLSVSAAMIIQRLLLSEPSTIGCMSNVERAELRSQWYPKMARTKIQFVEFTQIAEEENAGNHTIQPYVDVRRPEDHRRVWINKKGRKKLGALGKMKYQGEISTKK